MTLSFNFATSFSVTDWGYRRLFKLHKISTNLLQEWAAGSFEINLRMSILEETKNQSIYGIANDKCLLFLCRSEG